MHADKLIDSSYIKSADFDGKDVTVTITGVKLEKLTDQNGREKNKGIVSFKETEKAWVLNRTNVVCLKALFGSETDDWNGKRVTLFSMTLGGGETGIRVKGSPELSEPLVVEIKLPRKKPFSMTLAATGKR